MKLVKSVEIIEVDEEIKPVFHFDPVMVGDEQALMNQQIHEEIVRGRRFRNAKGYDVVIGITKEVQDTIGLPFEAFDTMERLVNDSLKMNESLRKRVNTASFWQRIKYLFSGKLSDL